jgi:hypothetical protein
MVKPRRERRMFHAFEQLDEGIGEKAPGRAIPANNILL